MASGSGTISLTSSKAWKGKIEYSYTQNTSAKTTTVTATVYDMKTDGYVTSSSYYFSGTLKVGSTSKSISYAQAETSYTSRGSASATITHDSNGDATVTISASITGPSGTSLSGVELSGSSTITLPNIDTTAPTITFSISNITTESLTISATASASCSSWKYTLDGGSTWSTLSSSSGTSVSATITGLTHGTTYKVGVRATKTSNSIVGTSAYTTVTLPGATSVYIQSAYRSDASGNETEDGSYATLLFTATSGAETIAYTLYKRLRGNDYWTTESLPDYDDQLELDGATVITEIDSTNAWEFYILATTDEGDTTSLTRTVQAAFRILDGIRSTKSIAIGKLAEKENCVDHGPIAHFDAGIMLDEYTLSITPSSTVLDTDIETTLSGIVADMEELSWRVVAFNCSGGEVTAMIFRTWDDDGTDFAIALLLSHNWTYAVKVLLYSGGSWYSERSVKPD